VSITQLLTIKILKWDLHNPRTDRTNYSWFKFQNGFFSDSKIYVLEPLQKLLLIYLFCEASKSGSGRIVVSLKQIRDFAGVSEEFCLNTFGVLETFGIIKLADGRHDDVTMTADGCLEKRREEERREDIAPSNPPDSPEPAIPHELSEIREQLGERKINQKTLATLLSEFPEPQWLIGEFRKMFLWEASNPRKKKKDFGRFAARWITKAWDERRIPHGPMGGAMPKPMRKVGTNVQP
jgi:hypothetical protein